MGSSIIRDSFEKITAANHDEIIEQTRNQVMELLKKTIRPEFLNRNDETIMFTPLNETEIRQIVNLQLRGVSEMLASNGITLTFTEEALSFIAREGYDPQFGARPVKRVIQRYVLNELSKEILSQRIDKNKVITIDKKGQELVFLN